MTRRMFFSLGAAKPCPPPVPKLYALTSGRSWGRRFWGCFSSVEALERGRKEAQFRHLQVYPGVPIEWDSPREIELDVPQWEAK